MVMARLYHSRSPSINFQTEPGLRAFRTSELAGRIVRFLVERLNGESEDVTLGAADALVVFGESAKPAIPALQKALRCASQDSGAWDFIWEALKSLDPEAARTAAKEK